MHGPIPRPVRTAPRVEGMRLRTFEIDADTVEYRVCRSTRYALTSSMAPLCLLVSVCLVGAISLGEGIPEPAALGRALLLTLRGSGGSLPFVAWLILGAVASLALAIASAASAVVSESVLVMRDVGVQLSVRTMLSRSPRSVRSYRRRDDRLRPRQRGGDHVRRLLLPVLRDQGQSRGREGRCRSSSVR